MPRKIVKMLVNNPVKVGGSKALAQRRTRRVFTDEFRREAVAMLRDGHSASSVARDAEPATGLSLTESASGRCSTRNWPGSRWQGSSRAEVTGEAVPRGR